MITFLAALLYVFFADTSIATRAALGVIMSFLVLTVGLLLYLEREGTVKNEAQLSQPWQLFLAWTRATFTRKEDKDTNADTKWGEDEGEGEGEGPRGLFARLVAAFRNVLWRGHRQARASSISVVVSSTAVSHV
jgi:hypothetical protein